MIDIHYLKSGGTTFSFDICLSIPVATRFLYDPPEIAFSANGSKFAVVMDRSGMSVCVWDIRSQVPLRTFMKAPLVKGPSDQTKRFLQFTSGNLGKEILVFVEVCLIFTF